MTTRLPFKAFTDAFRKLGKHIHQTAQSKGWWTNYDANFIAAASKTLQAAGVTPDSTTERLNGIAATMQARNDGEMIALIHSELSEALENIREGCPPDDKIPEFKGVEAELADVVIRIMDYAHIRGWRVAEAIEAKMKFNETRSHRHGGKKF